MSRMSRNAEEGFKLYQELFDKGVELVFIKEQHINTSTYKKALSNNIELTNTNVDFILDGINKYLMALAKEKIILAFAQAEKEVQDLHQRTKEGIETARLNGKQIGQRPGIKLTTKKSIKAKEDIIKYSKDFKGSLADVDVVKLIGISKNSFYKYKRELKGGINMNKIINLTPHAVNIVNNDNSVAITIEASGNVARCSQTINTVGNITVNSVAIPVSSSSYGEVVDLPAPQDNIYYIVSRLVMSACPNRQDLLVPNDLVRDEAGRVIGCRSLANN